MRTIRSSVFETNSSSAHALVMYSNKEASLMQNNLAWFNSWDRCIETASEIYDSLKNCVKVEYVTPDIIREIFQKIFERADESVFDFGNVESPEDFMRDYNLQDKHSAAVELLC